MSNTVDERVVSMKFDNQRFEKNVKTTTDSVNKLEDSLRKFGASKGFSDMDAAAKKVDVSHIGDSVDTVKLKFSAMQVMAVTALTNITNTAYNAGKRIVSALTIDPIKSGFSEYETQINAVQTILANTESKGKTLTDVNSALDELNAYADKTIYNFTEMTRNIGTFTAAGVDLDTSVAAIKGIANLAAVSGSTSQQASTAMYQLSQALASGTVKLMDWNSVVNAGMGGQVFQDALKETARVHGVAIDDMIKSQGSFRETLSDGWLTAEILTETLSKFTGDLTEDQLKQMGYTDEQIKGIVKMGETANNAATKVKTFTQLFDTLQEAAQSGWTSTWEIIVGDFEQAKVTLTKVSDTIGEIIGKSAEARNEMLTGWKSLGGRDDLLEGFANIFKAITKFITPIKEAFRELFPRTTAKQLKGITAGFKKFTEFIIISDKTASNIKKTFKGVFSVLKVGVTIIKQVVSAVFSLISNFTGITGGIFGITGAIGSLLTKMGKFITESNIFGRVINVIAKTIQFLIDKVKALYSTISKKFDLDGWGILGAIIKKTWSVMKKIFGYISKAMAGIGKLFVNAFRSGDVNRVAELVNSGIFAAILLSVRKFISNFGNGIGDIAESLSDGIGSIAGIFDGLTGCLKAFQTEIQAKAIMKIAIAIAILTASLVVLSTVDQEKLTPALIGIAGLFTILTYATKAIGGLAGGKGTLRKVTTIIGTALAVLILASALKKLASLEPKELAVGIVGILALVTMLVTAVKALGKQGKSVMKGATQLVIFAAAIKILASVCKDLSKLSAKGLTKGLVGIGVLLAEIALFLNLAKFSKRAFSTAVAIVILSSALKILASVAGDFASMSAGGITKGLAGIGTLLLELALFAKLTGNAKKVFKTSVAMVILASALKILVSVVQDFASMSWGGLVKGLAGLGGSLLIVAGAMHLMPKHMIRVSLGLIGVATGLTIIASVLNRMGNMSWTEIAKGLVMLGGSMLILAAGLHGMKGTLGGSAALLVAAASLAILAPVMLLLSKLSWTGLLKSLLAMAGAFAVLGIAGLVLGPVVPAILGLSAALALFGVAATLAGAGILALSIAFTTLSVAGVSVTSAIIAVIRGVTIGLLELIPELATVITQIIVTASGVIEKGAPAIAKAVVALVVSICDMLVTCIPKISNTVFSILISVLQTLVKYTPSLVKYIVEFVVSLIDSVASFIPVILKSVVRLFMSIFSGIVEALKEIDPNILARGLVGVGAMAAIMYALAGLAALLPSAMLGALAMGVVVAELAMVLTAVGALALIPGLTWIIDKGATLLYSIGNAIGSLIGGLVGGIAKGISSMLPKLGKDLSSFMINATPFLEGAKNISPSLLTGVGALVGAILAITGANLIDGIVSFFTGGSSIADFGKKLLIFGTYMVAFSKTVAGNVDEKAVSAAASAGKMMAAMEKTIPKTGGVVGFFTGNHNMATFGLRLIPFGKAIADFSDIVSSACIDEDAVSAAANAGKMMAELENSLPKSGGVVSWFTGDKDMGDFGERMVEFGKAVMKFASIISDSGIDEESVDAAGHAGKLMIELENSLPKTGGVVSWFTGEKDLGDFGKRLVEFGKAMAEFSKTVSGKVDIDAANDAASAGKIMVELENSLPKTGGVVSWFTGEKDMGDFGERLVEFGYAMAKFSKTISGKIDSESVTTAANAGKVMVEMESTLPKTGGVVSWFTGEKDMEDFGERLVPFGYAMAEFSKTVSGKIDSSSVTAAANAGKVMVEMESTLPKSGGVVSWFTGEKDMEDFGERLVPFGKTMVEFSKTVSTGGIDEEAVTSAANAGKIMVEMQSKLPKTGGVVSWFAGEQDLEEFGRQLVPFGKSMVEFSKAVSGKIDTGSVTAAANAGKVMVEMQSKLPKTGGVVSWFAGEKDLAEFGRKLAPFGKSMVEFSKTVSGKIDSGAVTAAANAGKTLAEMTKNIPEEGLWDKFVNWVSGEDSMTKFGNNIVPFGEAMTKFSETVSGKIDNESVTAASNAGKTLAEMAKKIPEEGLWSNFVDWICGDDMEAFADGIKTYGKAIVAFSKAVSGKDGINPEKITAAANAGKTLSGIIADAEKYKAINAANFAIGVQAIGKGLNGFATEVVDLNVETLNRGVEAGKSIGDMVTAIPNLQGTGLYAMMQANTLSIFATGLSQFGGALNKFSTSSANINIESVNKGVAAGKAVGAMTKSIPEVGGLSALFGKSDMELFGTQLMSFGKALQSFSITTGSIIVENIDKGVAAGKAVAGMINAFPREGGLAGIVSGSSSLSNIGKQLVPFARGIKDFANEISSLNVDTLNVTTLKLKTFLYSLKEVAQSGINSFLKSFNDSKNKTTAAVSGLLSAAISGMKDKGTAFENVAKSLMTKFITAVNDKKDAVSNALKKPVTSAAGAIKTQENYDKFYSAGNYLVIGFAEGIDENSYKAAAKAKAMAAAAEEAAREELDEHSPSKVGYEIGYFFGLPFVNAIGEWAPKAYDAGSQIAEYARNGLSKAVAKVSRLFDGEMDTQPTIRPVLDLSEVTAGVGTINGMLSMNPSIGVMSQIGTISSMMNGYRRVNNDDVISSLKELGDKFNTAKGNNYYSVNGITYDDGTNVADAVKTLVRAARVERRK